MPAAAQKTTTHTKPFDIRLFLEKYKYVERLDLSSPAKTTEVDGVRIENRSIPRYTNEFWTARQRQGNSIHEISYRACFKPQLPRFFIELLTKENDTIYDPFAGRGTTPVEAALLGRKIISNDVNPLSRIMCEGRLHPPRLAGLADYLDRIPIITELKAGIDLSMFYAPQTLSEILSIRSYLKQRKESGKENRLDQWIRAVATNRLTGHSKGFFSVYTLPPNQATTPDRQLKLNQKRKQSPEYRDTKKIILEKSKQLLRGMTETLISNMSRCSETATFLEQDAGDTNEISDKSVALTVTSPPFLNIVNYAQDNWLRCWFNHIDIDAVDKKITRLESLEKWKSVMTSVFRQLARITCKNGWVAFEVGEVKNGSIRLDEHVAEIGIRSGLRCMGIMINAQKFTKTANIWGVSNNRSGTNTNRIVLFSKE